MPSLVNEWFYLSSARFLLVKTVQYSSQRSGTPNLHLLSHPLTLRRCNLSNESNCIVCRDAPLEFLNLPWCPSTVTGIAVVPSLTQTFPRQELQCPMTNEIRPLDLHRATSWQGCRGWTSDLHRATSWQGCRGWTSDLHRATSWQGCRGWTSDLHRATSWQGCRGWTSDLHRATSWQGCRGWTSDLHRATSWQGCRGWTSDLHRPTFYFYTILGAIPVTIQGFKKQKGGGCSTLEA